MGDKIDWKQLSKSPGYRSLKADYVRYVNVKHSSERRKKEYYREFQWIINRAKHYAHHEGVTVEEVLNRWEKKRTYCWRNYYQDSNQPKYYKRKNNIRGAKGLRKYYKQWYSHSPESARDGVTRELHRMAVNKRTRKARWSMEHKKRMTNVRSYRSL